jgi:phosphate transport system protein
MTDPPRDDTRQSFDEQLAETKKGTLALGGLVLENIRRAAEAVLENDLELARQVVAADDEIDDRYSDLEHAVFSTLARQQPVARDLRFLVALTRVLYEIERSGDLAVNVAKGLLRRDGYTTPPDIHGLLARMSRGAADLFAQSLDALEALDETAGHRLDEADDEVDDLVGDLYSAIATESAGLGFDVAIELSRIGRYMERIADHAVNIAEHVTFMVTGSFPDDLPPEVTDEA